MSFETNIFFLSMLKNDYFQKGGRDPAILAQMRDLEFEAQRIQASQRIPPPLGKARSGSSATKSSFLRSFQLVPFFFLVM